jgi:hypothetical protein
MGLYTELPADLEAVDIIIAGGKYTPVSLPSLTLCPLSYTLTTNRLPSVY